MKTREKIEKIDKIMELNQASVAHFCKQAKLVPEHMNVVKTPVDIRKLLKVATEKLFGFSLYPFDPTPILL
jgi:hypothetical protein